MFGTVVAAVVEIVKPGLIASLVAKVPVVGPIVAGKLNGIESELGEYVQAALNDLAFSGKEYDGSQGFHGMEDSAGPVGPASLLPGRSLSDLAYREMQGVGNYAMDGVDEYAMAGLACPMADDGSQGG
jgi:hypothetical protein